MGHKLRLSFPFLKDYEKRKGSEGGDERGKEKADDEVGAATAASVYGLQKTKFTIQHFREKKTCQSLIYTACTHIICQFSIPI